MKLKLTLVTLATAATFALSGCAMMGEADGKTSEQANQEYVQFIKDAPKLEIISTGLEAPDLAFASIAEYAEGSYAALKELDTITNNHMDGYKAISVMLEMKKNKQDAELKAYQKSLDAKTKKDIQAYYAGAEKVAKAQMKQRSALLKAATAVTVIVKDKDVYLKGTNAWQKLDLGIGFVNAVLQADYAVKCSNYFDKFNAVLENAKNDLGK